MKKLATKALILTVLMTISFASTSKEFDRQEYEKAQVELESAVKNSNFKLAKASIGDLILLMKEDIKFTKALLKEEKKEGEKEVIETFKTILDRQKVILDKLEHIMEVSPAAVRASASRSVDWVKEFGKLSIQAKSR